MNYFLFTFLYRRLCTVKLNQLATSQLQHPILLVMQILTSMHHFWIFKKIKQVKEHILIPVSLKKKKKTFSSEYEMLDLLQLEKVQILLHFKSLF